MYATYFGIPWSIFVTIGIISLAYRRFIVKPKYLGSKISYTSGIVAIFISVLMITYMIDAFWTLNDTPHSFNFKIPLTIFGAYFSKSAVFRLILPEVFFKKISPLKSV